MDEVVIVGASLAGLRAAEALRREGFDGRLVLVGEEPHRPYDRPPLSKELLAGALEPADIALWRAPHDQLGIEERLGVAAVALDAGARRVTLADGTVLGYDGLVIATGATPRRLPGLALGEGIHVLRTLDDALALRAELERGPRVGVIGGGFIGAEVAATCRRRGLPVTVLEALPAPMARALGPRIGGVLAGLHADHGVDLRCGVRIEAVETQGPGVRVRLAGGVTVEVDVLVVAIGVEPATGWLTGSGLRLDDGVCCDATCHAAPGVVAAGDVARWPNPRFGGTPMRIEHWTNAVEQAHHAARSLLAGPAAEPFAPVPYVWSDQYDTKIQVVGHLPGAERSEVVAGDLEARRFVVAYGRDGRVVGAVGFDQPRLVMQARALIAAGAAFDEARRLGA